MYRSQSRLDYTAESVYHIHSGHNRQQRSTKTAQAASLAGTSNPTTLDMTQIRGGRPAAHLSTLMAGIGQCAEICVIREAA